MKKKTINLAKLAKILGQLGSDNQNVREQAREQAVKMLKDAGMNWQDVIRTPEPAAPR